MTIEKAHVHVESGPEEIGSGRAPHIKGTELGVLIQILAIRVKLFLRVNILQHLCSVPPLLISLYHNSIWLDFLNELLSSLSKHT